MSVTNDFLPFAIAGGANVETQAAYVSDPIVGSGQQPGTAVSALNNKVLRQGTVVASQLAQFMANQTGTNVVDNGVVAQFYAQLAAAVQALPPVITKYTTSTGTHNCTFAFFCGAANATSGATYTDSNSTTFTVVATIAAATLLYCTGGTNPAISGALTKTSGTGDTTINYYSIRLPSALKVRMVGGGGGGGGTSVSGGTGGNTTFGTSLLVANGGVGGSVTDGGSGGSASLGSGPLGLALSGGKATGGTAVDGSVQVQGGGGASSPFGGAGGGAGAANQIGYSAVTNSGSGGGGSGANATTGSGGGGAGGYVDATITTVLASYAYAVGAAGSAGTGTFAGGAGGSGLILIEQHF